MHVLLACDIDTDGQGNPHSLQLLHALETCSSVSAVQHGTSWMQVPEASFDVVHLHWPEALTSFKKELSSEDLKNAKRTLCRWEAESVIVTTVHNEHPHNSDSEDYRRLYQMVYAHSDGVIHLGTASKEVVRQRYANEIVGSHEVVIPHGNYAWFPNTLGKRVARSRLGIDSDARVVLAFGSVRSGAETEILRRGFGGLDVPKKHLWIVGRRTRASKRTLRYYKQEFHLQSDPRIHLVEEFVPPDEVQLYLNAADILVIPRIRALNSGNVALGFTFGRAVIGPDYGVIGEVLRRQGNPVYDPEDPDTWSTAMAAGLQSSVSIGQANKKYADELLAWDRIGRQHAEFYRRLLRLENTRPDDQVEVSAKKELDGD